jgi:hypothetical protein
MKTIKYTILIALFTLVINTGFGQVPPPPPDSHGQGGNQPAGGGAPIGSGLGILLALGAAYGGKKVWDYRRKLEE